MRRLLRWLLRVVVVVIVVALAVGISRYIAHRYTPGSVIVLQLDGPILERSTRFSWFGPQPAALDKIRQTLRDAQNDPRIAGLAIKLIDPQMELAQAQELSAMIKEFQAHRKWTTAYMETAGETDRGNLPYLVASSAQEVSMMPQGEMNLVGVGIRELFARGLLDNLKIKADFAAIGQYKSAANIFTQEDFTPAQREEDEALAQSFFDQIVNQTAANRRQDPAAIRTIVDRAPITAADGLKSRLLDRLEYEDEFVDRAKHYRGQHHDLIDYDSYVGPRHSWFGPRNKIAVVYGVGAIDRGESSYDPVLSPESTSMGSDDLVAAFKDAREDDSVRAVVFRIDSPGGSVIASELIRRAVQLCAKKKPVVVSMSGYGASGGYWVATPAARILADAGTITGSIGVLGGKFNIAGAAQAMGINSGAVTRGANAEMFGAFTDFTPDQAKIFEDQILGGTYGYFLKIVAEHRHMSIEQVNKIAQGRVWTGEQAVQNKLVDRIGGIDAAIAEAKSLAKLKPDETVGIVELPEPESTISRLLSGQIYGSVVTEPIPSAALKRLLWIMNQSLSGRSLTGQAYCPLVPVM